MQFSMPELIDMHCHVGLLGDTWPEWGRMSDEYRRKAAYKIFLLFCGIRESEVTDQVLRERTLQTIAESSFDKVVCLALDPVYGFRGHRREGQSHLWVDNDYIIDLRRELPDRILLGASLHPYDPDFEERVRKYVDQGAVLLKWLPSAQQINLADDRVRDAMTFLATAGPNGRALLLLLHTGPEYAIPSTDPRTTSYDYLCWSHWDSFINWFRFGRKWHVPNIKRIHENLTFALDAGADIIFAHCGAPYFFPGWAGRRFEHSEFEVVRDYLLRSAAGEFRGRCFADVSAFVTPFRRLYFDEIRRLQEDHLFFGGDLPTPAFELSADLEENFRDFKAIADGDLSRIVVPQGNLLDLNFREMMHAFPDHPMFTNFSRLGLDRDTTVTDKKGRVENENSQ